MPNNNITVDGVDYDLDDLNDAANELYTMYKFTVDRLLELENMQALLRRSKKSYISGIKDEIIRQKAGLDI